MLNNASKYLVRKAPAPAPASLSALGQDLHIIAISSLASRAQVITNTRAVNILGSSGQFAIMSACNILPRTGSHTTSEKSANLLLSECEDLNSLRSAIVSH